MFTVRTSLRDILLRGLLCTGDSTHLNITPSKTKMGHFQVWRRTRMDRITKRDQRINTLSKFKTYLFKHYMDQDRINHVCTVN